MKMWVYRTHDNRITNGAFTPTIKVRFFCSCVCRKILCNYSVATDKLLHLSRKKWSWIFSLTYTHTPAHVHLCFCGVTPTYWKPTICTENWKSFHENQNIPWDNEVYSSLTKRQTRSKISKETTKHFVSVLWNFWSYVATDGYQNQ